MGFVTADSSQTSIAFAAQLNFDPTIALAEDASTGLPG